MYDNLLIALRNNADHYMTVEGEAGLVHLLTDAADAIEKLQAYADLYKDGGETAMRVVEQYKARIEELQKQLQKSEADNVNLTGWLAEEHANNCPHYIRNVHDRGDDGLCDVLMTEPPKPTYKELLHAAKKMHFWIFLHSGDEQEAYDWCGLSDEMNAALGYSGQFELRAAPPKEETE